MSPVIQKRQIRNEARRARSEAWDQVDCVDAVSKQLKKLTKKAGLQEDHILAAYWPKGSEYDPKPLMMAHFEQGGRLALPVMGGPTEPLRFHLWQPGDRLVQGAFDIMQPHPSSEEVVPDIMLVPFLAFDKAGHRLGYGGGYYDRTIQFYREKSAEFLAIGLGFQAQLRDALPYEQTDQRLDGVLTEQGWVKVKSAKAAA